MRMKWIFLCLTLLLVMGCQAKPLEETEPVESTVAEVVVEAETIPYGDITVEQVEQVMAENPDLVLLDVRTEMENAEDALPDSVVIPVQELPDRLDELSTDQQYLVYCRSGNRSGQAMGILKEAGFEKLFHMLGGMNQYRQVFPKN